MSCILSVRLLSHSEAGPRTVQNTSQAKARRGKIHKGANKDNLANKCLKYDYNLKRAQQGNV
jgi:hypothetical protein